MGMSSRNMQLLSEAVGQRVPAIVAVGEGVVRRELLIKFVAEVYDPEGTGYWAVVHEGDNKLIDKLIEAGESVTVGLAAGGAKIFFETVILSKRRANLVQRQILLQLPEKASVVEQRLKPREWVPERMCIAAKLEVLSSEGEVLGSCEAMLWDLGQDGASIVVGADPLLEKLKKDAPLRLEIARPDPQLHLSFEAKHRHTECISDEKIRLGIQFAKDARSNKTTGEALMRLLEELHREGIRDAVAGTLGRPTSEGTRRRRSA
jgi:hypothetical protein